MNQTEQEPEKQEEVTTKWCLLDPLRHLRRGIVWLLSALALPMVFGGCATTERATRLVVDHHVGMARGAMDIMTGEAEAREQRVAKLRAELDGSRAALAAEQEQGRLVELLKQAGLKKG